jgi:hypothetical protein
MSEQPETIRIAVHVEAGDAALPELQHRLEEVDGVTSVDARPPDTARFVDPVSAAAALVVIATALKNGESITESIDRIILNLKQIGRDLGLPKLWLEIRRKKVDLDAITPEQKTQLAEELAASNAS